MANPALLGVQNYLGPQVVHCYAEGGDVALRRFVLRAGAAYCGLVLVFSLFLFAFGGRLIVLLYGDKYAGNSLVLYAMAANLVVVAATFAVSRGLFALERADIDFVINVVTIVLLLSAGLWLVRSWGVCGAAVSILLANTLLLAAKYVAFISLCGRAGSPAA
jgi:O-antigen/teichoic acid export membrane protein